MGSEFVFFLFDFKQLCHTSIYVISYLSQLPGLPHATYDLLQEPCGISNFLASFCHLIKPSHSVFHPHINVSKSSSKLYWCEALYLLSINRFRSSIRHCRNQNLQSTSTLQRRRHSPLLGPLIPQGIRLCCGTFPIATILEHSPLNAGMGHGLCSEKAKKAQSMLVPRTLQHVDEQLPVSCKGQQLCLPQAELAGGNSSELEGCRSGF